MVKRIGSITIVSFYFLLFLFLFLFYSSFTNFRKYWITTAMTTKSHQYLAKIFYSDVDILKVMSQNTMIEPGEVSKLSHIQIHKPKGKSFFRWKKIYGGGYSGYLVEIFDPTRISLSVSSQFGKEGETGLDIARREGNKIVMNAVGFYDPDWSSRGGIAHGTVIQDGSIISEYGSSNVGGGFAGFTSEGKLFLGKVSASDVLKRGVVDAVEFGPFLLINGKKAIVVGNGGFGIAPRSALAQRRDGTVLFLVINGRIPSSLGASMQELIDIMEENGAYNAVNMDGGSSSTLIINQKIINRPVGNGAEGLRKLPVFWTVK